MSGIGQKIDHLVKMIDYGVKEPSPFAGSICNRNMKIVLQAITTEGGVYSEVDRSKLYDRLLRLDVTQLEGGSHETSTISKTSTVFSQIHSASSTEELRAALLERLAPVVTEEEVKAEAFSSSSVPPRALVEEKPALQVNLSMYQPTEGLPKDYFQTESKRVVNETVETIGKAVEKGVDLKAIFNKEFTGLVSSLGEERAKIARAQGSTARIGYSSAFGWQRRPNKGEEVFTSLNESQYKPYEKKFVQALRPLCRSFAQGQKAVIQDRAIHGYKSQLAIVGQREKAPSRVFDYQLERMGVVGDDLKSYDNTFYVEESLEKDGQIHATSKYYVGVSNEDLSGSSEKKSSKDPLVVIYHQESDDAVPMMREVVASAFKECIDSKGKDPQVIKEKLAIFRYLFAHATPYMRGSAAVGEWFEKAIYKHCGYDFEYKLPLSSSGEVTGRPTADLDVLTSLSLSEFMGDYLSKAVLTEISPEKAQ